MHDLGLDLAALTRPGRKPSAVGGSVVRELKPEDFVLLAQDRAVEAQPLKRLSERHHALARALASGMKEGEAAAMLGLSNSRVSILKASPAFKELMALYRENADAAFVETTARLAGLTQDAVLELQTRLEDEPESISIGQLVEIVKMAADRSGHGPTSKQEVSVTHDLAARLESARKRSLEARQMQVIDVTPEANDD